MFAIRNNKGNSQKACIIHASIHSYSEHFLCCLCSALGSRAQRNEIPGSCLGQEASTVSLKVKTRQEVSRGLRCPLCAHSRQEDGGAQ